MQLDGYTYIYSGPGAWEVCVDQTHRMVQSAVDDRSFKKIFSFHEVDQQARVLVVPGGSFPEMSSGLMRDDKISGNVRALLQNGCRYLGICAGAMLGCNTIIARYQVMADERFVEMFNQGKLVTSPVKEEFGFGLVEGECLSPFLVKDPANSYL